ncbi:MAG TPA: VOC family protein [Ensifer sp.]|nr:VOC family protein [Ensifer sp.]
MTTVTQHLWFEKGMREALATYVELIPGSGIDWITPIPGDTPSGPAGSVQIAAFHLGDQRYMAIEAGPLDSFNHSFSILVSCDDQAQIDHLWEKLGQGGSYEPCGWLRDRWGLSWQISAKRLGELMMGPDHAAAKRVTEAMLKMGKIDIAGLERAAAG